MPGNQNKNNTLEKFGLDLEVFDGYFKNLRKFIEYRDQLDYKRLVELSFALK